MNDKEAFERIRYAVDKTWYSRDALLHTISEIDEILKLHGYPAKNVDKWEHGKP